MSYLSRSRRLPLNTVSTTDGEFYVWPDNRDFIAKVSRDQLRSIQECAAFRSRDLPMYLSPLYCTEEELGTKIQLSAKTAEPDTPITSVMIPTKNRPDLLSRCLSSWYDQFLRFGRTTRIVLADSSTTNCYRSPPSLPPELEVHVISASQVRTLVIELAHNGIPLTTAEFALLGKPLGHLAYGSARNVLLLATMGESALSCDDDVIPGQGSYEPCWGTSFYHHNDPGQTRVYSSANEMMEDVCCLPFDVLGEHSKFLGSSIAKIAARDTPAFNQMCDCLVNSIIENTGTVVMTFNGLSGDPGTLEPTGAVLSAIQRGEAVSDLRYSELAQLRYVKRFVQKVSIGHGGAFSSAMVGVRNTGAVPPYLPCGRGEDTLMGILLSLAGAESYFAILPFTGLHKPDQPRAYLTGVVDAVQNVYLSDVLCWLALSISQDVAQLSLQNQFNIFANLCISVSQLSDPRFDSYLRRLRVVHLEAQAQYLEIMCEKDNLGASLKKDILGRAKVARNEILHIRAIRLADLSHSSEEESRHILRHVVGQFGHLLVLWPHIREASKSFSQRIWSTKN